MKQNPAFKTFLLIYSLLMLLGLSFLLTQDKGELVLYFQAHRTALSDQFFYHLTFFGDGIFLALLALVFAIYRYKYTVALLCIGLGQLLLSALCKQVLFGRLPRPAAYFEGVQELVFMEGLRVHHWYSFPSGHTLTAFGLFFFVALVNEKRWIAVGCSLLAALIGLSRVYLGLHFLEDILAGSLLGIALTGVIYYGLYKRDRFWDSQVMNKSILGKPFRTF